MQAKTKILETEKSLTIRDHAVKLDQNTQANTEATLKLIYRVNDLIYCTGRAMLGAMTSFQETLIHNIRSFDHRHDLTMQRQKNLLQDLFRYPAWSPDTIKFEVPVWGEAMTNSFVDLMDLFMTAEFIIQLALALAKHTNDILCKVFFVVFWITKSSREFDIIERQLLHLVALPGTIRDGAKTFTFEVPDTSRSEELRKVVQHVKKGLPFVVEERGGTLMFVCLKHHWAGYSGNSKDAENSLATLIRQTFLGCTMRCKQLGRAPNNQMPADISTVLAEAEKLQNSRGNWFTIKSHDKGINQFSKDLSSKFKVILGSF
jgi:hypothetical protein